MSTEWPTAASHALPDSARRGATLPDSAGSRQHSSLVSLRGVQVRRGGRAILDVPALDVWPREVLAVVGPNGAGKSTLLQVMALLLVPDGGELRFQGALVDTRRDPVPVRRRMAVVF